MKTLILISALLAIASTTLIAQEKNTIEVLNLENGVLKNENNQFKIVSHEELDIDLTFNLKEYEAYKVLVYNKLNKIVCTKTINKKGKNKVYFNMDDNEEYTVKLINENNNNQMLVNLSVNEY